MEENDARDRPLAASPEDPHLLLERIATARRALDDLERGLTRDSPGRPREAERTASTSGGHA